MSVLPVIDVTPLNNASLAEQRKVANDIGEAARRIGFFKVVGHGIPLKQIENTYAAAERFFAQPEEVKRACYIGNSSNHRGYVPFTEKGEYADEVHRNYEAFDLALDLPDDDPDYLAGNRLLGPNVWPNLEGFREVIAQYYSAISSVGQKILAALELHLNLPAGELTRHVSKPVSQLRLLHYVRDCANTNKNSVNMGAHTDYECLTLLHTRNEGLQVMNSDDEWLDVPATPEAYVVNIGDMLEALTNGVFRSTPHRVLNTSPERFSLPYFVATNYDTVIEPFPSLISPENPKKYERFTAGAHLERMLQRDFPYLRNRQAPQNENTEVSNNFMIQNPFENRLNSAGGY